MEVFLQIGKVVIHTSQLQKNIIHKMGLQAAATDSA